MRNHKKIKNCHDTFTGTGGIKTINHLKKHQAFSLFKHWANSKP